MKSKSSKGLARDFWFNVYPVACLYGFSNPLQPTP